MINRKDSSVKYLASHLEEEEEEGEGGVSVFGDDVQPFKSASASASSTPKSKYITQNVEAKPLLRVPVPVPVLAPVRRASLLFQKEERRVLLVDGTEILIRDSFCFSGRLTRIAASSLLLLLLLLLL